jgi:hypothetical protein
MFALIKTNGASEIAIHIPGDDNCSTSLKQLALMLENNATFYDNGYYDFKVIKPEMSIILGNQVQLQGRSENGEFALVPAGSDLLSESFEIATPEVKVSYAKAKKEFEATINRLRNEKEAKDIEIQLLEQRIEELASAQQDKETSTD